jgi:hypothetical protein
MGRACNTVREEEEEDEDEDIQHIGGKARRKGTTRKTRVGIG